MCFSKLFGKKTEFPVIEGTSISRDSYLDVLQGIGIVPISIADPLDPMLSLASKEELDQIAPALVYPADWYLEGLLDCEDYGLQAQLDAGRKFHVSARLCLGWMELGYHGFALAMDKTHKIWLLEPNAGFPHAGKWFAPTLTMDKPLIGEMYVPKKIFI